MIKSFTVTNYLGESMTMSLSEPERSGMLVLNCEGLGPAKASINATDSATNDGSVYNSARLEKRNIVLTVLFYDSINNESVEDLRHKTYQYFPLKKNLELTVETDIRTVTATGYVESNEPTIFSSEEGTVISIVCPDPYMYDSRGNTVTDLYSIEPIFEFPFSNESPTEPLLVFSEIHNSADGVVNYVGDANVGVTITIHAIGPAKNVTIYNLDTREAMKIDTVKMESITGKGFVALDDIVITTSIGRKSITLVREGKSYNILNCLDKDASWLTLSKGDNMIAFTSEEGITNLQFRIENKVLYEGA